jgi:hypothetical protein
MNSILKDPLSCLHGADVSPTDVLLYFIRTHIKLNGGTIGALVHILVDVLDRVKALAPLDVNM